MAVALAALTVLVAAGPEPALAVATRPPTHHSNDGRVMAVPLAPPAVHPFVPTVVATAGVTVPIGQTFGGAQYGVNPTSVESDVNSMDGTLEISHTDIRVAGIGVPFVLDRQYNSRDVGTIGAFGAGWSSILDLAVRFSNHGTRAVAYGEDGQQVGFTYDSSNKSWTGDPGVRASLVCSGRATNDVAPATCTVTRFSDGVNWTLTHGLVQDYRTAAHQGLVFAHTGGRISRVTVESTATKPLVIQLTRNATGLVTELKTPTRSVSYSYDSAGDLTAVTDSDGNVWRMSYASGHLLVGVGAYPSAGAKSGVSILKAVYDSTTKRVTAATERLGSLMHDTTFSWSGSGETGRALRHELMAKNGGPLARVTYTDIYSNGLLIEKKEPLGEATTYRYDRNMDLTKLTSPLGSVQTMKYDAYGDELSTSTTLDSSGARESETFTYDPRHRLTTITQPVTFYLTDKTKNTYNASGELASSASSGAGATKYTYNSHALRTSKTDGEGNVTSYTYDADGDLTGESVRSRSGASPEGFGPLFAYNESGQQVLSVPALGNTGGGHYIAADATRTTYSPDGQESRVTSPSGATSTTQYDAAGDVIASTDPMGNRTTYSWSQVRLKGGSGWEKRTTNPAGETIDIYDPSGDVLSSTPPQPSSTMSGKPAGVVTDVYNADGEVTKTTNGQGVSTSYQRDGLGEVVWSLSRKVYNSATYNLVGWATSASTTTYSYPPDNGKPGKPKAHTTTTHTAYGLAGQVATVTDAAGGTVAYSYGPGDRVTTVEDRSGRTKYTYDDLGDITSVTSPTGDVTKYAYDGLGRESSQTIGSQRWTVAYDADGNAVKTVDPDGRTATYRFDAMNRKTGVTYSWAPGTGNGLMAPPVTWTYNLLGERTQMTDGVGTTSYSYDSQGRLLTADTAPTAGGSQNFSYDYSTPGQFSETYPDGATITYHTDDGGNLMGISVPAQSDGSPAFDTGNMLPTTAVTQGSTSSATAGTDTGGVTPIMPGGTLYPDTMIGYTFNQPQRNAAGTPTVTSGTAFYSASMANSATTSNPEPPQGAYVAESDLNGNLLGEQWGTLPTPGGSGSEMTMKYGYNGGGLETAVKETGNKGAARGGVQLTSWSSGYQSVQGQDSQYGTYAYNGDGNPTFITAGLSGQLNWNLKYNSTGEISSVSTNAPDPSNTSMAPVFSYDKAGNMTQAGSVEGPRSTLEQAGADWTFAYNDAGQLASAKNGSVGEVDYSYDGDGNLVYEPELLNGVTARTMSLIWDPRSATPQLAEANQYYPYFNATVRQRYIWGNGPVGMEEEGSNFVFHDNQNGTPTMVTNSSGQTVDSAFYDPHGNFLDGVHDSTFPDLPMIGFDGSYNDPYTGLDLMGARFYDPALGMFTSRGTPAPPTPGTALAVSEASTHTIGMSTSPGTSPLVPVSAPATSYSFGAQNPTNEGQLTGTTVAPSTTGIDFKGLAQGAYATYETVSPYATGTLAATVAVAPAKALYKQYKLLTTQTPTAAEQSAGGAEVAGEGTTTAEDATKLAGEGNTVEDAANPIAEGAEVTESTGIAGKVVTVASVAAAVYETVAICNQDGSTSSQCIGQALGTAISFAAQAACEVVTAGAGSAACGVLQSVLYTVIPLFVEGNGQALLDSATFSSGFNIADANVLTAQYLIASALGPIGVAALLGEVIYANFGAIENAFVISGDAITSALISAGQAYVESLETVGGAIISGVSTAGSYAASGFQALAAELSTAGLANLATEIATTITEINYIADQVGSALCDFVSSVSCLVSSIFAPPPPLRGAALRPAPFGFTPAAAYRP
jgi:YD repeat-containing protein